MKKVLIACQFAENKGDRAIAEYLIYQLRKQHDIEIVLSTTKPELWSNLEEQGVEVIGTGYKDFTQNIKSDFLKKIIKELSGWFYKYLIFPDLMKERGKHKKCFRLSKEFINCVKSSDLTIVTGGHHITSIRNKNALFGITYDIGLISLFSKKYVLWSQTIGPLEFTDPKPKMFFERVIRNAEAVYIRDDNSIECLKKLYGEFGNIKKSYDSVFGFGNIDFCEYNKRENKVGISIFNGLQKAFGTFEIIAKILDKYVSMGYSIEFFRMEHIEKELDDINKIIALMKTKGDIKIFPFSSTTSEHLEELSKCKFYIGYKTHSVIMALTTATPLFGICYHKKTRDFMEDYGLADYAVDDELLEWECAETLIDRLCKNAETIHNSMSERSKNIAVKIEIDIREMLNDFE